MRRLWSDRLAWLPIPILLAAIVVLWAADLQASHESLYLLLILNLVCSTPVCLVVAYLIARSFLVRGAPGLLLLGCGVVIWGPAGVVATVAAQGDANTSITIYNCCLWLSGLCHLTGVSLSLRPRRSVSMPALWLPAAYALAIGAILLVTLSALAGWIPTFFVEQRGGTPVRQIVLFSAALMFALTALLLIATGRRSTSAFAYWYALALALIAIGLFGVMLQTHHASLLGWTGRATQALGGLYLLVAAIASVRESRVWEISLEAALEQSERRYRTLVETAPDAIVVHRDGRFLYANSAALALAGAPAFEQLTRHTVPDFFRSQDREQSTERMRLAQAGGKLPMREAILQRLDGREVAVEFHTASLHFRGAPAVLTIIRDVTERKVAEDAVKQALRDAQQRCAETSALMACTRAVLEHQELVATVGAVFDACRKLLAAQAGYVGVLTRDGNCTQVLFLEPGGSSCTVDPSLPMPLRGLRAEAYHTGRVVYENDFRQGSRVEQLPPGHVGLENVLFAPLVVEGHTIGLLGLGNKQGGFTDHDATLAATFGELLAIALRNTRMLESLHELNATLESKVAQRTAELERRSRQLQKLTLELMRAEDRERQRIAALLHEDLQQHLAAAKFHLSAMKRRTQDDPQFAVIDHVDDMLKEAIEKSRNLSRDLSPALLHLNDLREVLQWLATQAHAKYELNVQVDMREGVALPSETLTTFLFRAAQEILFNVTRHARVQEALIRVRHVGHYLYLSITDRGCGFDPQTLKHTRGFGLLGIRERLHLLGGRMKIRSTRRQGSTVVMALPYHGTSGATVPVLAHEELA